MNFKFEIQDKILRQKKSSHHDNFSDNLVCSFTFETKEWNHLDKYVIFWNKKGKSTIRYITDKERGWCEVPQICLDDLYFYIQVYANDKVYTQKLKVFNKGDAPHQEKPHHQHQNSEVVNNLLKKLDNKIDKITYEDNCLCIYSNDTLVDKIDLVDQKLIYKILSGQAPGYIVDTALSPDSDNPLANKTIYELITKKVEYAQLSRVAFSGKYGDLSNIPSKFTPKEHTHSVVDIIDFETTVDDILDQIAFEFYKGD